MLDGQNNNLGYRSVWHHLQMKGTSVPRKKVATLLKELDPQEIQERRAQSLRRSVYQNPGLNAAWHCDEYDKLKQYGFPIHGCIDGWSQKILCLFVTRSNNQPHNIGTYYLESVKTYGGCPVDLGRDLGMENGILAVIHAFFRNEPDKHRCVPSPRNQRIESWWAFFSCIHTLWWMDYYKDFVQEEIHLTKQPHIFFSMSAISIHHFQIIVHDFKVKSKCTLLASRTLSSALGSQLYITAVLYQFEPDFPVFRISEKDLPWERKLCCEKGKFFRNKDDFAVTLTGHRINLR